MTSRMVIEPSNGRGYTSSFAVAPLREAVPYRGMIMRRAVGESEPRLSLGRTGRGAATLLACAAAVGLVTLGACEDVVGPTGDPVALSFAPCVGAPDNPSWFAY